MKNNTNNKLSKEQQEKVLSLLEARFAANKNRHKGLAWEKVEAKLKKSAKKLWSLSQMEETGGEPDVVGFDKKTSEFIFVDCSVQSPEGRRSTCYDGKAQKERKEHAPERNAVDMAKAMGVTLLTEDSYRKLQKLGEFDTTTSSWIETPAEIRKLGGAVFCDRRYETVFLYHNGADSYYAARGWRGQLRV